jgi:hypothetical protein
MDTVRYVSELFDWDTTTPETVKTIWDARNALQIPSPYTASSIGNNTEAYLLDAFLDALSVNNYEGDYQQWRQAREQFALGAKLKQNLSVSWTRQRSLESRSNQAVGSSARIFRLYYHDL